MKNKYNLSKKYIEGQVKKFKSSVEIAKKYGCSRSLIVLFCKKNNIKWPEINLIGKKFNQLEVIERIGPRGEKGKQSIFWKCKCECGNFRELSTKDINQEKQKSCGCYFKSREYRLGNCFWNGHEDIHGKWWTNIKRGAKKRKHKFEISIEWAWNLFLKQNKKCALSGDDLCFANTSKGVERGETTASLDRIDSSIGYTEDNVQWVHKDINLMKQGLKENIFLEYCKKIINYNKEKNENKITTSS